jgi:hypothetical protein
MFKVTPTVMTRAEAHSQGLRTYYTGVPCRRGHLSARTVAQGACMECMGAFKTQAAKNAFDSNLVPYASQGVWRPKYWDFETLKRFNEAVQKLVHTWEDAPPVVPVVEARKFRKIYGENYYSANAITGKDGEQYDLWFTQKEGPRPQACVREHGGPNAQYFEILTDAGLLELPWVFMNNRWYALDGKTGQVHPVVKDEQLDNALSTYGVDG